MSEPGAGQGEELSGCWGKGGVGCVTLFAGGISGGMIGVAISMIVAKLTRAPTCQGIPSCNWHYYAGVVGLIGALTLPALALWRLRGRK